MRKIVIFDLDGTLSDTSHREHYITKEPLDWDSFHKACVYDPPISNTVEMYRILKATGHTIYIISGRLDAVEKETRDWLDRYGLEYDYLFLKPSKIKKVSDIIYKKSILKDLIKSKLHNFHLDKILCVFEDRTQMVEMYRGLGLTCYQVAKGDF